LGSGASGGYFTAARGIFCAINSQTCISAYLDEIVQCVFQLLAQIRSELNQELGLSDPGRGAESAINMRYDSVLKTGTRCSKLGSFI
jgi:hypothetical protein